MTIRQKLIILCGLVLAVLLYFAPKQPSSEKTPEEVSANTNADFISSFAEAKKNLAPNEQEVFSRLEADLKKAQTDNNEQSWLASADDFLKGARYLQSDKKALLYKGAMECYEKVLSFNPNNLAAKTNLGTAIVESSPMLGTQPMKGITLLREVVQADSNNIEANLQLGLFSVTSQQFDKAIERFKRILKIDSAHIDMYVYLGDTYAQMGEKSKAIENFEKYKALVNDTLIVKSIDEHIKELKKQP